MDCLCNSVGKKTVVSLAVPSGFQRGINSKRCIEVGLRFVELFQFQLESTTVHEGLRSLRIDGKCRIQCALRRVKMAKTQVRHRLAHQGRQMTRLQRNRTIKALISLPTAIEQ